jgi:hypothetical protein
MVPLGEVGRLEKKECGKPPDPLQRLHDTARLLRARDLAPLFKAATSRPEEGERLHDGADISSRGGDVKRAAVSVSSPGTGKEKRN